MTDIINNFQEFYLKDDNWILKKIMIFCEYCTAWKVSKYGVISGPYFSVFRLNTGKYGPEKNPYSDTFHTVLETAVKILSQTSCHYTFKPEDPYTIAWCT